jgi:hypothetical protein
MTLRRGEAKVSETTQSDQAKAEEAVIKKLGLPSSFNFADSKYVVRYDSDGVGGLVLYEGDPDDKFYIYVGKDFRVAGWMRGSEAKQAKFAL